MCGKFFHSLKIERIHGWHFSSKETTCSAIFTYIDVIIISFAATISTADSV
ncbi:IS3 family transposase [Dickeya chrysanthemi]|uniref:IS3 family transposase n=1 Tax=Dickeya chrysanthemi TaxID=556 RepID=UPI0012DE84D3